MPWCPNCKMEYQDGFTVCSDCKTELVDELEKEGERLPFIQAAEKDIPEKLVKYFEYSGLPASMQFNEENEVYEVFVSAKKQKLAKKLYQAFMIVEMERKEREAALNSSLKNNSDTSQEERNEVDFEQSALSEDFDKFMGDTPTLELSEELDTADTDIDISAENENMEFNPSDDPDEYVMKADKYKDLRDTVWVFLVLGFIGLGVVILNVTGIFTFLQGIIPNLAMAVIFLFFIYVGLSTQKKAKQVHSEIDAEKKLIHEINEWLSLNMTESLLNSLRDENVSEEVNYLKVSEVIKTMIKKDFGDQNSAFLDRLIDEYYSNHFDKNE